jgi:acyl-CoA thioesterase
VTEVTEVAETSSSYPHASDLRVIPLGVDPSGDGSTGSFELTLDLTRPDGALYGGTGVAASVMAMEAATQRDALWVLTQFVAPAQVGSRLDWTVERLAMGGRIAQLRVSATVGDALIFCALGATARPKPDGLDGRFLPMPAVVDGPEDSGPLHRRPPGAPAVEWAPGYQRHVELREATAAAPEPNQMLLWARMRRSAPMTRAGLAFVADMIPVAVARAAGRQGAGFSLDNAYRFGAFPETEWVLLDLRGDLATSGYGHGSLEAWTSDGVLIATGSQTANMAALR